MSAVSCKPATSINIRFESNTSGIFHPGDTINGIVELYAERKIKKTQGLKLEVVGIANCAWSVRKIFKVVNYEGSQKLMEHVSHFFGRVDGAAIEVPVGVHLYTFSCTIPLTAASSYEGTYGSIKYSVKVTLNIPYMSDVVFDMPFTVVRVENLNYFPWLRCKSESQSDIVNGIDCFQMMPLVVTLRTRKSGFANGEECLVSVEARNQGPAKYSNTVVAIDRVETYLSHFPIAIYKRSYKLITYIPSKSVKPFETLLYEEKLIIPDEMHGTSQSTSETVRISYQIRYTSKSNRRSKVQVLLPIFIGHVALSERFDTDSSYDSESESITSGVGKMLSKPNYPSAVGSISY